jgi:hypothetical protein
LGQKRGLQVVNKSITSGRQLSNHCSLTNFLTNTCKRQMAIGKLIVTDFFA